jgi:hypothetical protein
VEEEGKLPVLKCVEIRLPCVCLSASIGPSPRGSKPVGGRSQPGARSPGENDGQWGHARAPAALSRAIN